MGAHALFVYAGLAGNYTEAKRRAFTVKKRCGRAFTHRYQKLQRLPTGNAPLVRTLF